MQVKVQQTNTARMDRRETLKRAGNINIETHVWKVKDFSQVSITSLNSKMFPKFGAFISENCFVSQLFFLGEERIRESPFFWLSSVDWTMRRVVTPVKNQLNVSSCAEECVQV